MDYRDRLLSISDEREDDGGGFFVDLKDGWSFGFGGNGGMFDTLKEVTAVLKASKKN